MPLPAARRLRLSKADKVTISAWQEGVNLEQISGSSIDDLLHLTAAERWRLGLSHRRQGVGALNRVRPGYRCAISRFYYAMYQAMRSVAYLHHAGDDFEGHSKLPAAAPGD